MHNRPPDLMYKLISNVLSAVSWCFNISCQKEKQNHSLRCLAPVNCQVSLKSNLYSINVTRKLHRATKMGPRIKRNLSEFHESSNDLFPRDKHHSFTFRSQTIRYFFQQKKFAIKKSTPFSNDSNNRRAQSTSYQNSNIADTFKITICGVQSNSIQISYLNTATMMAINSLTFNPTNVHFFKTKIKPETLKLLSILTQHSF